MQCGEMCKSDTNSKKKSHTVKIFVGLILETNYNNNKRAISSKLLWLVLTLRPKQIPSEMEMMRALGLPGLECAIHKAFCHSCICFMII